MAMKGNEYKRQLGKPMGFSDWQDQYDEIQGDNESDADYARRMRIKRNKRLEKEGKV